VEMRGALWGALAFNGLSLVAALIELTRPGGVSLLSVAILGVSVIVAAGVAVAIRNGGR
jgi:hypothetical protein